MALQANSNEIVAASLVHLNQVPVDGPCAHWNSPRHLRHFSVVRKLDGQPFPAGACSTCPACVCVPHVVCAALGQTPLAGIWALTQPSGV